MQNLDTLQKISKFVVETSGHNNETVKYLYKQIESVMIERDSLIYDRIFKRDYKLKKKKNHNIKTTKI